MKTIVRSLVAALLLVACVGSASAEIELLGTERIVDATILESEAGPFVDADGHFTDAIGQWDALAQAHGLGKSEASQSSELTVDELGIHFTGTLVSYVQRYDAPAPSQFYAASSTAAIHVRSDQPMTMGIFGVVSDSPGQIARIRVYELPGFDEVAVLEGGQHSMELVLAANQDYVFKATAACTLESAEPQDDGANCLFIMTLEPESAVANEVTTWSGVKSLFE